MGVAYEAKRPRGLKTRYVVQLVSRASVICSRSRIAASEQTAILELGGVSILRAALHNNHPQHLLYEDASLRGPWTHGQRFHSGKTWTSYETAFQMPA